jgi:hypothetical protein
VISNEASGALGRAAVWVLFALLFLVAISVVLFGFIGYYSRVSLGNELRQSTDPGMADHRVHIARGARHWLARSISGLRAGVP